MWLLAISSLAPQMLRCRRGSGRAWYHWMQGAFPTSILGIIGGLPGWVLTSYLQASLFTRECIPSSPRSRDGLPRLWCANPIRLILHTRFSSNRIDRNLQSDRLITHLNNVQSRPNVGISNCQPLKLDLRIFLDREEHRGLMNWYDRSSTW